MTLCLIHFPQYDITGTTAIVEEGDREWFVRKLLGSLLCGIEGMFAVFSLALLFSLPICTLEKVVRTNSTPRLLGILISCLMVAAIIMLEIIRFSIRSALDTTLIH
jgi:hypothetical protein